MSKKRTYGIQKDQHFTPPRLILERVRLPVVTSVSHDVSTDDLDLFQDQELSTLEPTEVVNVPRVSSPVNSDLNDPRNNLQIDDVSTIYGESENMVANPFCVEAVNDFGLSDDDLENEDESGNEELSIGTPLSEGAYGPALSLNEFSCLIVALQCSRKANDMIIDSVCKIIRHLLPFPNNCPASVKALKTIFRRVVKNRTGSAIPEIRKFRAIERNRSVEASYFFCDIGQQIKAIVDNYGSEILQFLTECSWIRNAKCFVTDLITGELYNKYLPNPDGNVLFLHLLLSADGARFTKAKTGNFWPIHATVVELPPKVRAKFENSILLSMWQGALKPDWETVLREPVAHLKFLEQCGIPATINGVRYEIRVRVLATVFDLPARASIWNVIQYNGAYGCMQCTQKGEYNKLKHKYLWPFDKTSCGKSTSWYNEVYDDLKNERVVSPHLGVKGESFLLQLNIDPATQNPLDLMHQSYEGVFNRILDSLFGKHRTLWNLGKSARMRRVDELLRNIKFPADYQRQIPSLENLNYFKAAELKHLLLYGLIPCLQEELLSTGDDRIIDFFHWLVIFNEIIIRLSSDTIRFDSLTEVDNLISIWQKLLPTFLGDDAQTFNAHAMKHLTYFVRLLGPLHHYSTFAFESFNGTYAKFVSSTHGTLQQVARRMTEHRFIRHWIRRNKKGNGLVPSILSDLTRGGCSSGVKYGSIKISGKQHMTTLPKEEVSLLKRYFPALANDGMKISVVEEIKVGSVLVRSFFFEREQKSCTHIAKFRDRDEFFARIDRIFTFDNAVFAFGKKYQVLSTMLDTLPETKNELLCDCIRNYDHPYGNTFKRVKLLEQLCLLKMSTFQCRCLSVDLPIHCYIMEECMKYEHN